MVYLSYFIHSWLIFVTPLKFLRYKSTLEQQVLFTVNHGLGIILTRSLYEFSIVPFGTHTILMLIISIILFKNILKDFGWQRSIYTSLIIFIILLINDAFILLPFMKLFSLTVGGVEQDSKLTFIVLFIITNLSLILIYLASVTRDLTHDKRS